MIPAVPLAGLARDPEFVECAPQNARALAVIGQLVALALSVLAFAATLQVPGFRAVRNFTWFTFGEKRCASDLFWIRWLPHALMISWWGFAFFVFSIGLHGRG